MNTLSTLFLASTSSSRAWLLSESRIPFVLLKQTADEAVCRIGLTLVQLVSEIAKQKMAHVILPELSAPSTIFVLTADTLCQDTAGTIVGKPESRAHAYEMIRACRKGFTATTAFCIEKKQWDEKMWTVSASVCRTVSSTYVVDIPDELIDLHIDTMQSMQSAGAATIEGFGMQFLKVVQGSYSNILGLPLYEVRQELLKIGFSFSYK